MTALPCGRCHGSGIDPEDSYPAEGPSESSMGEPPVFEPCRDCQSGPEGPDDARQEEFHTVAGVLYLCHVDDHYCPAGKVPCGHCLGTGESIDFKMRPMICPYCDPERKKRA